MRKRTTLCRQTSNELLSIKNKKFDYFIIKRQDGVFVSEHSILFFFPCPVLYFKLSHSSTFLRHCFLFFCFLQKKYYFCCLVFNIYDIVYFMKKIANTISHTAVYGRVIGNAMCCTSNAYFLIPSIFVHNLKKTIHIPLASRWRGWHISEQIKNLK